MCKTRFGSQGVILDGFKHFFLQNTLMARETPPLHGKCYFKFPFWLFEPLPLQSPCYKRFAAERRCCSTSPRSSARLSSLPARKWWHFFKWRHFSHWDSSHPLLEQRRCLMWDDNVRILQIKIFQALLIFMVSPVLLSLSILSFEQLSTWKRGPP